MDIGFPTTLVSPLAKTRPWTNQSSFTRNKSKAYAYNYTNQIEMLENKHSTKVAFHSSVNCMEIKIMESQHLNYDSDDSNSLSRPLRAHESSSDESSDLMMNLMVILVNYLNLKYQLSTM